MFNRIQIVLAALVLAFTLACEKGGDEAKAKGAEGEATKTEEGGEEGAAGKAEGAKAAEGGDDEIICCEFGAAIGTSTEAKCAENDGKVREDLEPPCTK